MDGVQTFPSSRDENPEHGNASSSFPVKERVHRDLKPENIFVLEQDGQKDHVKIVDFGIARVDKTTPVVTGLTPSAGVDAPGLSAAEKLRLGRGAPAQTLPGMVLGTPAYMSPEQGRGEDVGPPADQYALGCILFEMLCGQPVYKADNLLRMLSQHVCAPVPSLLKRAPQLEIPEALDALVQRAMAKQPEERFPSMRELGLAIEAQAEALLAQRSAPRELRETSLPAEPKAAAVKSATETLARRQRGPWRLRWLLPVFLIALLGGGYTLYEVARRTVRSAAPPPPASGPALSLLRVKELRQQALSVLQTDLHTADAALRRSALAALGQTREPSVCEPLLKALHDGDAEVQAQAAEALGQLGSEKPRPELWQVAQHSPQGLLRVAAAGALDQLEDERGRTLLRQLLRDKDTEVRLRAAYFLCSPSEPEAKGVLASYLARGKLRDDVAVLLYDRLAQSGEAKARQQLLGWLASGTLHGASLTIAVDLARLGEEQGRIFLHEQARRPGAEQVRAARALAELDEPGYAELFRRLVRSSEQSSLEAHIEAVAGLGASGEVEDMLLLQGSLDNTTAPALRQASAVALLQLSDRDPEIIAERSFQWAKAATADERWFIRETAVAALGDSDSAAAVPMIGELLHGDAEARVRQRAARALGRRVEDEAVAALCKSLHDDDTGVRMESLRSLGRIGQTLLTRGEKEAPQRIAHCLRERLKKKCSPQEQILGAVILGRLGDEAARVELRQWEQSADPALRRFLVEQLADAKEVLARALNDAVLAVRFAAAQKLAELGDRQALPVLRSVLQNGGSDGIIAYGLLRRLGESAPSPTDVESLLQSPDVAHRLSTVEAIGQMPTELALPLLKTAARDAERLVRRLVAEVAADLKEDAEGRSGVPVLRLLAADLDLSVRTRAAALLSRFLRGKTARQPAKPLFSPPPPPPASNPASEPAQEEVKPAPAAEGPSATPAAQDPTVEQLNRQAAAALGRKDLPQAQRLFDRAQALCTRKLHDPAVCGALGTDASYQMARAYEAGAQWAEAMAEYQRVAHFSGARRAKPEQRSAALEAIVRLSPRLGRIVIAKLIKGKCQLSEMWMPPGTQTINIGGELKQVKLLAQDTVTLQECQLKPKPGKP